MSLSGCLITIFRTISLDSYAMPCRLCPFRTPSEVCLWIIDVGNVRRRRFHAVLLSVALTLFM